MMWPQVPVAAGGIISTVDRATDSTTVKPALCTVCSSPEPNHTSSGLLLVVAHTRPSTTRTRAPETVGTAKVLPGARNIRLNESRICMLFSLRRAALTRQILEMGPAPDKRFVLGYYVNTVHILAEHG